MRVNTLKSTPAEFLKWAKAKDWMTAPVPWCPEGFFVDRENRDEALGKDLLHVLGHTYMQEAASMLPVALLDPKPGDTVLDMSAAPGSKTSQIAARMNGKGVLIANDVQEKRIWSLLSNLQRCGVINVVVSRKVGQWFAGNMTERFDRVLCDAPCTAQGTVRKDTDALQYCSDDNIGKMARLQCDLLESAIHSAKVGGRIIYSTCTLTPEENEGVVQSMLNKFSDQLSVLDPKEILAFDCSKSVTDSAIVQKAIGITKTFPAMRLWPQTFDTEGFFSVVFQKNAPTKDKKWNEELHRFELIPKSRYKEIGERLIDWYGASFLREDEVLIESRDQMLVLPQAIVDFKLPFKPYFTGLPFGKFTDHGLPRLSHELASLRGHEATKQLLMVSEDDYKKSFAGANISASPKGFDDGDVLLALKNPALKKPLVFGRGVLKKEIILNRLPREIVRMFS